MIYKTRGIALRTTNYSDTSIIVKIYTEQFGIQNYLIKGAKRKNAPIRANSFFPLSLLELVVYKKEKRQLQILKEVRVEVPFSSIPNEPGKTSILFFLNEVLLKCLQEEENNPELFSFLHESIQTLETSEKQIANFHLLFLIRFSRFLGFYPQGKFSETNSIFDLQEGTFINTEPMHPNFLGKEDSKIFSQLIYSNYYSMDKLILSGEKRKNLLNTLLHFYQLHLTNMKNMLSNKILEQVLS